MLKVSIRELTVPTLLLGSILLIDCLGACSSIESVYTDVPKGVAAAQATLAAAEHTAVIYASLPKCGTVGATLCRDPAITAKIGTVDTVAFNAVETAYKAETQDALNAALTALNGLTSITDNLSIPTVTPVTVTTTAGAAQ